MTYFLIFAAATLRVIPHAANFAPVTALALFGGTYLNKKTAVVVPLGAMILSDFFIGFDSWQSRTMVYGSFVLIGFIGLWIRNHKSAANVFGGTLASSILFYLITNFAYFYPTTMYPHNLSGIIASYINALPFFRNTLLGDFFYVGVMFGAYEFVEKFYLTKKLASRKVSKG